MSLHYPNTRIAIAIVPTRMRNRNTYSKHDNNLIRE